MTARGKHQRRRSKFVLGSAVSVVLALAVSAVALAMPRARPRAVPAISPSSVSTVSGHAGTAFDKALARLRWADADTGPFRSSGATVALMDGVAPRAALQLLVPHPDERGPLAAVRAWTRRMSTQSLTCAAVSATRVGRWTIVVASGRSLSLSVPTLDDLAAHGSAVVVSEDDTLDASFSLARNGKLVRRFDPVLGTSSAGTALPQEQGIDFGVPTSMSAMSRSLMVVARLTGVEVTPGQLRGSPGARAVGYCA